MADSRHRLSVDIPESVSVVQMREALRALGLDPADVTRLSWQPDAPGTLRVGVRLRRQVGAVGSYVDVTAELPIIRDDAANVG